MNPETSGVTVLYASTMEEKSETPALPGSRWRYRFWVPGMLLFSDSFENKYTAALHVATYGSPRIQRQSPLATDIPIFEFSNRNV